MPAVDLEVVKTEQRRQEERDAAVQQLRLEREREELIARALAWERVMNRTFKGIMSRPVRHLMMRRVANRGD